MEQQTLREGVLRTLFSVTRLREREEKAKMMQEGQTRGWSARLRSLAFLGELGEPRKGSEQERVSSRTTQRLMRETGGQEEGEKILGERTRLNWDSHP